MNPFPQRRQPLDERREAMPLHIVILKLVKYGVLLYIAYKFGLPAVRILTSE